MCLIPNRIVPNRDKQYCIMLRLACMPTRPTLFFNLVGINLGTLHALLSELAQVSCEGC